jgi:hypothetical protein
VSNDQKFDKVVAVSMPEYNTLDIELDMRIVLAPSFAEIVFSPLLRLPQVVFAPMLQPQAYGRDYHRGRDRDQRNPVSGGHYLSAHL